MSKRPSFYSSPAYRAKQSRITKDNQRKGIYAHLEKSIQRMCARPGCPNRFSIKPSDPKRYCSRSCSAIVNNIRRVIPQAVREKIARAMTGKQNPYKGVIKVARLSRVCANPLCGTLFTHERYRERKFCSTSCAMKVTGGKPTSPKASRGKAGIRTDVSESIYFYSRWEANMARLYTHLKIQWVYAPKSFDIGEQMYTPDFYLPETDTYVEVKNFWGEYSRIRDAKFRARYKDINLKVLLKDEYMQLEQQYAHVIPEWEYKNSRPPATA